MKFIEHNDLVLYIEYYKFLQRIPELRKLDLLDENELEKITAAQKSYGYENYLNKLIAKYKEE